jgi:hypothetical protein
MHATVAGRWGQIGDRPCGRLRATYCLGRGKSFCTATRIFAADVDRSDCIIIRRAVDQPGVGKACAGHHKGRRAADPAERVAINPVGGRGERAAPLQIDMRIAGCGTKASDPRRPGHGGRFVGLAALPSAIDGGHLVVIRRAICQVRILERVAEDAALEQGFAAAGRASIDIVTGGAA